jgi:hypothetical protein
VWAEATAPGLERLGRWRDGVDRLLATNDGKVARECLTLIRVIEGLQAVGYGVAMMPYAITPRAVTANAPPQLWIPPCRRSRLH